MGGARVVFLITCFVIFIDSSNCGRGAGLLGLQNEAASSVDMSQKDAKAEIRHFGYSRLIVKRASGGGNAIGGPNANADDTVETTTVETNEIQYSESGKSRNNQWEVSLKPAINDSASKTNADNTNTEPDNLKQNSPVSNSNTTEPSNNAQPQTDSESVTSAIQPIVGQTNLPNSDNNNNATGITKSGTSDNLTDNTTPSSTSAPIHSITNTSSNEKVNNVTSIPPKTTSFDSSNNSTKVVDQAVEKSTTPASNSSDSSNNTTQTNQANNQTPPATTAESVIPTTRAITTDNISRRSIGWTDPTPATNATNESNQTLTNTTSQPWVAPTKAPIQSIPTTVAQPATDSLTLTSSWQVATQPDINSSTSLTPTVTEQDNETNTEFPGTEEPIPEPDPTDNVGSESNSTSSSNGTTTDSAIGDTTLSRNVATAGIATSTQSVPVYTDVYDEGSGDVGDNKNFTTNTTLTETTTASPTADGNVTRGAESTTKNEGTNTTLVARSSTTTKAIPVPSTEPVPTPETDKNTTTPAKTTLPANTTTTPTTARTLTTTEARTTERKTSIHPDNTLTSPQPSPPDNNSTPAVTVKTTTPRVKYTTPPPSSSAEPIPGTSEQPATEEPSSEPEGPSEPEEEPEPESEPELDLDAFAEPGPDWKLAKNQWQEAWELHVYFFGTCFAILGLFCVASVVRLWGMEHLLSRHYFLTLHVLVIIVCLLRATYLLVDAYNSRGTLPMVIDYFLYNTTFPCISAAFSILFYALLLATRVRVISPRIQKFWVLFGIIALHFGLSVATDLIVGLFSTAAVLIFICQVFFIVWGLMMFIGYLIVFRKLYKGAVSRQKTMKHNTDRKHGPNPNFSNQEKGGKHKYTFGLAVKITFISAFFGVAIVGFELYGMFGVYGVLRSDFKPLPWPWWSYHVILRTLELLMCSSIAYVASQPLRYTARKDVNKAYRYLLPCNVCCCNDSLDSSYDTSTISMENVSADTDHLGWLKKNRNKKISAPYPPHASEKYTDPDATLLVRKIKQSKPSMLVVEDGFVRIRREDEMMPSNQYELDSNSRSSRASSVNNLAPGNDQQSPTAAINWNYNGNTAARAAFRDAMPPSFSLDNYRLPSVADCTRDSVLIPGSADDTDIDIVVTDSELSDGEQAAMNNIKSDDGAHSMTSGKSGDIFRPLSMIDLAASMESELDRAFHSSCKNDSDLPSRAGGDLPPRSDVTSGASAYTGSSYNYSDMYCATGGHDNTAASNGDSDSDQSKTSSANLIRTPFRRCKSEEKPSVTKSKLFENNRYYSLSSVESAGKYDECVDLELDYKSRRT